MWNFVVFLASLFQNNNTKYRTAEQIYLNMMDLPHGRTPYTQRKTELATQIPPVAPETVSVQVQRP